MSESAVKNAAPAVTTISLRRRTFKIVTPDDVKKPPRIIQAAGTASPIIQAVPKTSIRRVNASQFSQATRYTNQDNLARGIYCREALENAIGNNARQIHNFVMNYRKRKYIAVFHDGDPFASEYELCEAMYANTSINEMGANGCGGTLSPLLLSRQKGGYHNMFMSRMGRKFVMFESTFVNEREMKITRSSDEVVKDLTGRFGEKYLKETNVAYFARYDIYDEDTTSVFKQMTLMKDFCPSLVSSGCKIYIFNFGVLAEGEVLAKVGTDHRKRREFFTREAFDAKLSDSTYRLFADGCSLTTDEKTVVFDAEVDVVLNAGLVANTGGKPNWSRYGYTNTNPKGKGSEVEGSMFPEYNTFVTLDYQDDPGLDRLNHDPCYAWRCLDKAAQILNLAFSDRQEPPFYDVDEFPELQAVVKAAGGKIVSERRKESDPFMRVPHASMRVRITKVHSLEVGDKVMTRDLDSDSVRNAFGNTDEMFMVGDRRTMTRAVTEILGKIADDDRNRETLAGLRLRCAKLWPRDYTEMGALPLEDSRIEDRLHFIDKYTGEPVSSVAPDTLTTGLLRHVDSNTPVDADWAFGLCGDSKNTLQHVGDDEWELRVSPFHIVDEGGKYQKVDAERWVNEGVVGKRLPTVQIRFTNGGRIYTLSTRVELPKGEPKSPRGTQSSGRTARDDDKYGHTMFKNLGDVPGKFVGCEKGCVCLNKDNVRVRELFRDVPQTRAPRIKLWNAIRLAVATIVRDLAPIECRGKGKPGRQIGQDWNDDFDLYAINSCIKSVFYSTEADKIAATNNAWVNAGNPLGGDPDAGLED